MNVIELNARVILFNRSTQVFGNQQNDSHLFFSIYIRTRFPFSFQFFPRITSKHKYVKDLKNKQKLILSKKPYV